MVVVSRSGAVIREVVRRAWMQTVLEEELSGFANRLMQDTRELEVAYRSGVGSCVVHLLRKSVGIRMGFAGKRGISSGDQATFERLLGVQGEMASMRLDP